ncbi:MAG TPA: hypothetical protein VFM21_09670, partial [Terriglobia bacterium]|nr:hypothetical protein [Terriglobia bacterium]
VQRAPGNADCWAMLSLLYREEYTHGFNLQPDPIGRAYAAARRAVEGAPSNHLAYQALAGAYFFRRELQAFRNAAERAITLNPMDGFTIAYMGFLTAYSGDWERGCALAERARSLNPHYPGWYWFPSFFDAYRKRDYRGALDFALKVNMPGFWRAQFALAVAHGQLGELEAARQAVRELLRIRPDFAAIAREELGKWWDPELIEHLIEGLRKAGLEIDKPASVAKETQAKADIHPSQASAAAPRDDSGRARAGEGFWVAVLPFRYSGANPDLKVLAEGLPEEIVTGLSRFSYLRVIARGATTRFATEGVDVRAAGRELGAQYVLDGSLRQVGAKLRLAVQLVDATSGAHLWAETYDRAFNSESLLDLQDDLVPRIVSTVADWYGVLPHSMSQAVRAKPAEQLTPYEAVLRMFQYYERVNAEEHAISRACLERAVQQAPGNSDAWAMLAMMYGEEFRFRFNVQPDSLGRSLRAAQRAVDAAPSNHSAYLALAQAFFFRKEFGPFRDAAERALKLNPMDGATCQYLGHLLAFSGDWEYGCAVGARSRELNPNHPVWYWALPLLDAYRKGDYQEARKYALKFNLQGLWLTTVLRAAVHAQLGEIEAARTCVEELLALAPDSAAFGREELSKWYPPELVDSLLEGLRKAGLDIRAVEPASRKETRETARPAGAPQASAAKTLGDSASQARDAGAEGPIDSLAVLPFENLSGDPEMDYLSEGITDIMINNLSQIRKLRVAPRGVIMRYKGREVPAETAAAELNVRAVLSGRVTQRGDNLIVGAELLDVAKTAQIWGARYTRKVSDLLALQEEIASEISDKLRMELSDEFKKPAAGKPAYDKDAYQLYLKALYFSNKWSPQDLKKAIEFARQAIELDPSVAPAHATMAMSYAMLGFYGMMPPREALPRARSAALRAIAIDDGVSEAHAALALTYIFYDWDWANGEREAKRAIEANPNLAFAHLADSVWPIVLGKFEQATVAQQRALDLDPLSPANNLVLGAWLMFARKYDRAIEQLRKAVELDPTLTRPREVLALTYALAGKFDLAEEECRVMGTLSGGEAVSRPLLGYVYALAGRTDEARAIL